MYDGWNCLACGQEGNTDDACDACGVNAPGWFTLAMPGYSNFEGGAWDCQICACTSNTTDFCQGCGHSQPSWFFNREYEPGPYEVWYDTEDAPEAAAEVEPKMSHVPDPRRIEELMAALETSIEAAKNSRRGD